MAMTNIEFAQRAADVATNYKTLYVTGCFGWPLNEANKKRIIEEYPSKNGQGARYQNIMASDSSVFGFDCVNLVKALIWGWNGNSNAEYGGCVYESNGMEDITVGAVMDQCIDPSTDFSKIEIGEYLWMSGHCGIYIGNGLGVECTPKWDNKVQITAVGNIGSQSGYNTRNWTKHGKLPQIQYVTDEIPLCIKLKTNLKRGDKGYEVLLLQTRLASLSPELEAEVKSHSWKDSEKQFDGTFGKGMMATVQKVQTELGLEPSGACDDEFRAYLNLDFINTVSTLNQIRTILKC